MIVELLKQAIEKSGISRYQISRDTGVDQAVLCRMMKKSGTCGIKTADTLCRYLGLVLVKRRNRKAR